MPHGGEYVRRIVRTAAIASARRRQRERPSRMPLRREPGGDTRSAGRQQRSQQDHPAKYHFPTAAAPPGSVGFDACALAEPAAAVKRGAQRIFAMFSLRADERAQMPCLLRLYQPSKKLPALIVEKKFSLIAELRRESMLIPLVELTQMRRCWPTVRLRAGKRERVVHSGALVDLMIDPMVREVDLGLGAERMETHSCVFGWTCLAPVCATSRRRVSATSASSRPA